MKIATRAVDPRQGQAGRTDRKQVENKRVRGSPAGKDKDTGTRGFRKRAP
jgi:hypothetical protein